MKIFEQIKGKALLFLVSAILILCAGFIIISCGDPELKTTEPKKGQCAIDFTRVPDSRQAAVWAGNASFPSIVGRNLTVEAWIKPKADSATAGGIFGRYDNVGGVIMWVRDNIPKFAMRVMVASSSDPNVTSTIDYTVEGTVALAKNVWHHIAGVLVNDDHTNTSGDGEVHGPCSTPGAESEMPHLDLYVNGHFIDCATNWGDSAPSGDPDPATGPQGISEPGMFGFGSDTNGAFIGTLTGGSLVDGNIEGDNQQFEGVIDEVRLWTVARTSKQIYECMGRELSTSGGGDCGINPGILKGYWRFNECEHADALDWSGAGSKGIMEVTLAAGGWGHWEDGWVEGVRVNGALLPMD
jgi:hypothetical protein